MRVPLIAAAFALLAPFSFAGPAQAAPWLAGDWEGTFECGERKIPLKMEFFQDNQGDFFGGFAFRPKADDYISLRLHGTFSAEGVLSFQPRMFVTKPRGSYEKFGFTAQAFNRAAEGKPDQLVGEAPFPGCGRFTVERKKPV